MADVLLTHSYHLYYDRKQMRKMQPYPPLGTLYAAALLRSAGLSVTVFDTMLNDPGAGFQAALEQHRPRIVVVYAAREQPEISSACAGSVVEVRRLDHQRVALPMAARIAQVSAQTGAGV